MDTDNMLESNVEPSLNNSQYIMITHDKSNWTSLFSPYLIFNKLTDEYLCRLFLLQKIKKSLHKLGSVIIFLDEDIDIQQMNIHTKWCHYLLYKNDDYKIYVKEVESMTEDDRKQIKNISANLISKEKRKFIE